MARREGKGAGVSTRAASGGEAGEARFAFGSNWRRFVEQVDESNIRDAEESLQAMLGVSDLEGRTFLDIGSGSGLFSLAATRLGAQVTSFDSDAESVMAAKELRDRFAGSDTRWDVAQGDVLDPEYLSALGEFDVVYSWGVLHHTGRMWDAMENVVPLVKANGRLFISIYNDQGGRSELWRSVKRRYVSSGPAVRFVLLAGVWALLGCRSVVRAPLRALSPRHRPPVAPRGRGMSAWHDLVDWVGGFPYEVATPEAVFSFFRDRGFLLDRLVTRQGSGCNEFVFIRSGLVEAR